MATDAGLYPDSRGFKNTLMIVLHSHPALPITHVEASSNVPWVLLCHLPAFRIESLDETKLSKFMSMVDIHYQSKVCTHLY